MCGIIQLRSSIHILSELRCIYHKFLFSYANGWYSHRWCGPTHRPRRSISVPVYLRGRIRVPCSGGVKVISQIPFGERASSPSILTFFLQYQWLTSCSRFAPVPVPVLPVGCDAIQLWRVRWLHAERKVWRCNHQLLGWIRLPYHFRILGGDEYNRYLSGLLVFL